MNIQKLNELAQQNMPECLKNKTYIHGTWQIVQFCPSLITREWVNIGVGFKHGTEQDFKFLTEFRKVLMLWGLEEMEFLSKTIEMVEQFFKDGVYELSSRIKVIEVGFHKAESVEEALQSSFDQVVSLRGWGTFDFLDMPLDELQAEHSSLVDFNTEMNRELNMVRQENIELQDKLDEIKAMVSRVRLDADVTLTAIQRTVG